MPARHSKTELKGRYSLTRITLAICTCGLSFPFTGIRTRTTIITTVSPSLVDHDTVVVARGNRGGQGRGIDLIALLRLTEPPGGVTTVPGSHRVTRQRHRTWEAE